MEQQPSNPEHLFRYFAIPVLPDQSLKRVFFESCVKTLKFSTPKDLNDPFDLKINLNFEGTTDENWRDFYRDRFLKGLKHFGKPPLPPDDLEKIIEKDMSRHSSNNERKESLLRLWDDINQDTAVVCFSQNNSDILMWSHYADKHRGFCLKYDFRSLHDVCKGFKMDLYKVQYPPNNELTNFTQIAKEGMDVIIRSASTKSKHWSYEQEWRIIHAKEDFPIFKEIPTNTLAGIIFGLNMQRKEGNQIRSELERLNIKIPCFEAKKKGSEFGLDIIENVP